MGQKRAWCDRAATKQAVVTIDEKQTWKQAPGMFLGSWIRLLAVIACIGLHASIGALFINWAFFEEHQPGDMGFWSAVFPSWAIAMSIIVAVFLFSFALTQPSKRRMKRALLPVRCQRCPKCFYDLSQRTCDDNICPECGVISPRRECVRLWCKLLRTRF